MLHRDNDKPAVIKLDGTKKWYRNGFIHRDNDLPAIVWSSGGKEWYQNGKLYRENGKPLSFFQMENKNGLGINQK